MSDLAVSNLRVCGDDLIALEVDDAAAAQQVALQLRRSELWLEVVPGMAGVVVQFDSADTDPALAVATLREQLGKFGRIVPLDSTLVTIDVVYGGVYGPDLAAVCAELGMDEQRFIDLHTSKDFGVDMLGFTPGFAYVSGSADWQALARLDNPRQQVAAGSIGVAAGRTGIYALAGPGGWPLIGRTARRLFDPHSDQPFLLQPGMRVRFAAAQ
jgi:allophanate hydrolase